MVSETQSGELESTIILMLYICGLLLHKWTYALIFFLYLCNKNNTKVIIENKIEVSTF